MSLWWLNGLCVNLISWNCMLDCVGACGWLSLERTVAGTGFLAQASLPRLGEISRGSPRTCCSISRLDERFLFLSEEWSRLGEKGLAWARPRRVRFSPFAISPRREGFRLSERTPLAWAGPISLSEIVGWVWYYCWMVHWCVIAYLI